MEGHRAFGTNLGLAEALKRAALVERLFPEYARCRVTPINGRLMWGSPSITTPYGTFKPEELAAMLETTVDYILAEFTLNDNSQTFFNLTL